LVSSLSPFCLGWEEEDDERQTVWFLQTPAQSTDTAGSRQENKERMRRVSDPSIAVLFCVVLMVTMSMVKTSTAQTQTFTKIPYEPEPRCDALLPNTLIVSFTVQSNDRVEVTITKLDGSTFFSDPFSYNPTLSIGAVPGFNRVVSLENGLKAPALIFCQFFKDSPSRMDLFVDTQSIRSSDPSNPDFTEKTICMIKFSTTALSSSSEKTVEPTHQHLSRAIDTCAFGGSSLISFEDASDCIQSVAFNQDQRKRTLDALDILADIYVYRDININSPGEDPVQVDLVEELDDLRDDNFESNYDFHDAVRKLFIRGRDTHTQYSIPVCYQQFSFFQPFSLYSTIDDNDDQVLVVSPRPNIPDESRYGFSPAAYDGHIVEEIDGKKAMDYYIKWVNKNVIDKQESNRFNAGLGPGTGKDLFCRRDAVIPENPFMTWTLVSPITNDRTTLEVPWLARTSLTNYNSNQFASLCLEENVERACGPSRKREETHLHHHELRSFNPNDVLDTIGTTSLVSFSRETGVLSVPSFELLDYSPFWISQSFTILYLEAIHRYHFNRLMIDVSNNGGGFLVLVSFWPVSSTGINMTSSKSSVPIRSTAISSMKPLRSTLMMPPMSSAKRLTIKDSDSCLIELEIKKMNSRTLQSRGTLLESSTPVVEKGQNTAIRLN